MTSKYDDIMNTENKSIGVFIDGGYFAKINEALQDKD